MSDHPDIFNLYEPVMYGIDHGIFLTIAQVKCDEDGNTTSIVKTTPAQSGNTRQILVRKGEPCCHADCPPDAHTAEPYFIFHLS